MPASKNTRTSRPGPTPKQTISDGAVEGMVVDEDTAYDFDLDGVLEREADNAPFRFPYKGTIYELPNASVVSLHQARRMEDGEVEEMLAEVAGEELADLISGLPTGAFKKLIQAWMAHAGLDEGKTPASRT